VWYAYPQWHGCIPTGLVSLGLIMDQKLLAAGPFGAACRECSQCYWSTDATVCMY